MTTEELKDRFQKVGIRILKLADTLSGGHSASIISRQIGRSASSAGANYRAACRSKSPRDFINKLKIVEEELDETEYWLEMMQGMKLDNPEQIQQVKKEINELIAITVASIKTAKANLKPN